MLKLIICLDGTGNSEFIEGKPLTNVTRLRRSISHVSGDGLTRQIVHYQGGIGTSFGNPFNFWQQGFGNEIQRVIVQAYTFLCDHYHAASQDQIFLIGFSRGAFAARCLADLIYRHGIIPRGQRDNIHELYQYWSNPETHTQEQLPAHLRGDMARVTACALWDTVGAVGIPIYGATLSRRLPFINSDIPDSIDNVFQALALHEHRHHFFPIVLHRRGHGENLPRLEQCWFAGYHADVGGGNRHDALAHFPLVWIMSKLRNWINFDLENVWQRQEPNHNTTWVVSNPNGPYQLGDGAYRLRVRDSMTTLYKTGRSKYRLPQTEFWNEQGIFYPIYPNQNVSEETIHPTTRYLMQTGLVAQFHAVERFRLDNPRFVNSSWIWTLRYWAKPQLWRLCSRFDWWPYWSGLRVQNSQDSEGGYDITEENLDDFQAMTLRDWVTNDMNNLDLQDHPAGTPPPQTILVQMREWLSEV